MKTDFEWFLSGMLTASAWDVEEDGVAVLEDYAPKAIAALEQVARRFFDAARLMIQDDKPRDAWANDCGDRGRWSAAGHDFWLTAVGHGAGFWDGDWPHHGDRLTALVEETVRRGSLDVYRGDDGKVYATTPA